MSRSVCIVDARAVTAFGDGMDALWQGLQAERTAITRVGRFSTERYITEYAACVPALEIVPHTSRIYALIDRALAKMGGVPRDAALLTATTKSGIDVLETACRTQSNAGKGMLTTDFMRHVQRRTGVSGKACNINAACASSTIALARGAAMIANGQIDSALICCADLVSEFVFSGFSALQALSPSPSQPFDKNRTGLTLGEGAAALLLMGRDRAQAEGRDILATLSGWGVANDANHVTAPARDGCGLIEATNKALAVAELEASAIKAISAHGTATVYNDLMELTAFRSVFSGQQPPMNSIKGAIGHTLGAAGGIEAALAVRMLKEQVLPPTIGFVEPEDGADACVSNQGIPFQGDHVLTTNSGFGGINAVLVISTGEAP